MPLPVSVDATWLNPASVQLNAQELRRADSALLAGDGTALGVRGGIVRHGDLSLAVTVNASDVITVQPGAVVIPGNVGVGNGCYRTALEAADTGTLTARNATNPRIDLVVFRVLDTDVVGTHGAFTGRVEVITGTPAASPVAPALPTLAVELARVTVPASAGGSATVDSSFRTFAASLGGVLPVTTAARLPTTGAKWETAVAADTGTRYTWDGVAWRPSRLRATDGGVVSPATSDAAGLVLIPHTLGVIPVTFMGACANAARFAHPEAASTTATNLGFIIRLPDGSPAPSATFTVNWVAFA